MYSNWNKLYHCYDLDTETNGPDMIRARIKPQNPSANLRSYYETCRNFSWAQLEEYFQSIKTGRTNIVSESIDKWLDNDQVSNKTGLIFAGAGEDDTYTYLNLKEYSCQMANLMVANGLAKGDRLVILLAACPELYITMLACARIGVIFSIIDESLGVDAMDYILHDSKPKAVLTDHAKAPVLAGLSYTNIELALIAGSRLTGFFKNEILVNDQICHHEPEFETALFDPDTPLFIVYISGSTSGPKGVTHSHKTMLGVYATAKYVLDLNLDSILWSDADLSSMVGVVYGCFAPWLCGATSVMLGIPFSASACYLTLERRAISVWFTNPLNLEKLMQEGDDLVAGYDFSKLSHIVSAGKNLAPELFYWVRDKLKVGPHDSLVMTEAGMICMANYPSEQIKLGSMGKPFPGVQACIIDEKGEELPIITLGELAFRVGWPSMMLGIWGNEARTNAYYRDGWFLTGDLAIKDEDGYYYHHGRLDDLLRIGCKYVGPYLIENVIRKHASVDEVAVILKKNTITDLVFKAYITLKNGAPISDELSDSLVRLVKTSISQEIPLHEIEFVDCLPKSGSGALLRRVLTALDLGLPSGDITKLSDCKIEV